MGPALECADFVAFDDELIQGLSIDRYLILVNPHGTLNGHRRLSYHGIGTSG